MTQGKKKSSGSRDASQKQPSLGLVIALAAVGGVVIGSAGTYALTRPLDAPLPSAAAPAGGTSVAPTVTMTPPPQQPQFTPAPQPPGEVPPGKIWSVEHGHWHDAPTAQVTPVPGPSLVVPAAK